MELRIATTEDADAIAALHADNWRRHYRGAYSDEYLDGNIGEERQAFWRDRLATPDPAAITIVAIDEQGLAGFAHTILDEEPPWGALLDNLHVTYDRKRSGLGRRLMAATARAVLDRAPGSGLFLWVLEQNVAAQAFYDAQGGSREDTRDSEAPGGGGRVTAIRYAWRDPATLLSTQSP